MKILVIDTSSSMGVVSIGDQGRLLGEIKLRSQETHSARLLPSIDWLLRMSNWTLDELDGFAVVTGPGSFTGLRVGLATIKGLSWAKKKPVATLHSLEVLAQPFVHSEKLIAPMLDARKGRVYAALYRWKDGRLNEVLSPADMEATSAVMNVTEPVLCLGDGSRKYEQELLNANLVNVEFAPPTFDQPEGSHLIRMAYDRLLRKETVDITNVEPIYLRLSEAELKEKTL